MRKLTPRRRRLALTTIFVAATSLTFAARGLGDDHKLPRRKRYSKSASPFAYDPVELADAPVALADAFDGDRWISFESHVHPGILGWAYGPDVDPVAREAELRPRIVRLQRSLLAQTPKAFLEDGHGLLLTPHNMPLHRETLERTIAGRRDKMTVCRGIEWTSPTMHATIFLDEEEADAVTDAQWREIIPVPFGDSESHHVASLVEALSAGGPLQRSSFFINHAGWQYPVTNHTASHAVFDELALVAHGMEVEVPLQSRPNLTREIWQYYLADAAVPLVGIAGSDHHESHGGLVHALGVNERAAHVNQLRLRAGEEPTPARLKTAMDTGAVFMAEAPRSPRVLLALTDGERVARAGENIPMPAEARTLHLRVRLEPGAGVDADEELFVHLIDDHGIAVRLPMTAGEETTLRFAARAGAMTFVRAELHRFECSAFRETSLIGASNPVFVGYENRGRFSPAFRGAGADAER